MLLATGKADVCPRFASTTEWDTAAAYAVIKTIGVVVIDKDTKQELTNNKESCVTHGKRI